MVNSRISVEVIQGEATAAGVTFTLNLTNNGNQKISDIKITDDQGNRVNSDSFALAIGENRQLTYNVVTEEERYVTFSITGVTTSGDKYRRERHGTDQAQRNIPYRHGACRKLRNYPDRIRGRTP